MKTNRIRLEKALEKHGYIIGCYDKDMEGLKLPQLKKVIDSIGYGSCEVLVSINRKKHVVEIDEVDNEIDFAVKTLKEYTAIYGERDWE